MSRFNVECTNDPKKKNDIILAVRDYGGSVYYNETENSFAIECKTILQKSKIERKIKEIKTS